MQASEIISQDAQRSGVNPDVLLSHISKLVGLHTSTLMQKGNSVLQVTMIAPKTAELHLYTVDTPNGLKTSIQEFFSEFKSHGIIHTFYGKADNPHIIPFMKSAGIPVEESNNPKYNWMVRI